MVVHTFDRQSFFVRIAQMPGFVRGFDVNEDRSEEHTSELQSH